MTERKSFGDFRLFRNKRNKKLFTVKERNRTKES